MENANNKENEPLRKNDTEDTVLNKATAYIIASFVCIVIFFLYQILAVTAFGGKRGGGFLPMAFLMMILIAVWKWIVSFSKTPNQKSTEKEIAKAKREYHHEKLKRNIELYILCALIAVVVVLCIIALISFF